MMDSKYPEHDKLKALAGKNTVVANFLDWLDEQGFVLCTQDLPSWFRNMKEARQHHERQTMGEPPKELNEVSFPKSWFIAQFFGIDETKFSQEKDQMVEEFRRIHHPAPS